MSSPRAPADQQAMVQLKLAKQIDALLPQTQCRQCGFAGCAPYAQSVAGGNSPPTLCKPGGNKVTRQIAALIKCEINELKEDNEHTLEVALIDEERCVGCYKCIEACPMDAIIGAHGHMHTVLGDWCTGCGLCVEPCPADCIELVAVANHAGPAQTAIAATDAKQAQAAANSLRQRFDAKQARPGLREPLAISQVDASELAGKAMRRAQRLKK